MSIIDSEATRARGKCYVTQILAPELLAMIFHDVMALHERRPILLLPTTDKHPENEIDTKPLLTLSHVCRYWRDVALGTPAFWTRVHGRRQDQMDAFLERSRPLAVTLFLDEESRDDELDPTLYERIVSVISAHSRRLRRLDLGMLPACDHVVPLLETLFAPQLEYLTIMSPFAGSSLRNIVSWTPLLEDKTSSLRALGLLSVVDWLPSSAFPNLTHLVLYFGPETEELLHPFDLLQLLSNTPALEFLHVDLLIYEEPYMGSWQPPSDPVSLLHLRSLVFTDCPYKILHVVLPRLSFPEDVFIRLQDITNWFPDEGPAAPLPPLSLHPVTHLDVAMRGEELLMVADGPTSGLWFEAQHDLDGYTEPQDWSEWLLGLHECLPLAHVTHLHIYVEGWETFWPAILARLPQVAHLAVLLGESSDEPDDVTGMRESPTTTLCDALSPGEAGPVLCPVLDTLAIEWPREIMREDFLSFPRLPEMLKARSRAGHPICHVIVQVPAEDSPSVDEVKAQELSFPEFHKLANRGGRPHGTEYEVVEKPAHGRGMSGGGLCTFQMREVWRVDGEDRYWDVDERGKPSYNSVSGLQE